MTRKTLLWLVPILLTIHNLEEAIFVPAFLAQRNSSIPATFERILPQITYRQFLIALLIVTAIPYLIAVLWRQSPAAVYLLLGIQVVMLINVLAHFTMAILVGGYAPGLVTALVINLPFSLYLLRRARLERWVSRRAIALMFPIGLLIHGPALWGLMILAGQIAGRF